MQIEFTTRAREDFDALAPKYKAQVRKQLALFSENLRHPSLRAKKYIATDDVWQGRIKGDPGEETNIPFERMNATAAGFLNLKIASASHSQVYAQTRDPLMRIKDHWSRGDVDSGQGQQLYPSD